ncbi:MAG TPA: MFS transporter [Acidimicrobiales bacterium]|nr:MFS transporter [Acidimicrobiales bacterium]
MSSTEGRSESSSEGSGGAVPGAPKRGTALLATLALAQFMVVLDFTIVNVALPSIQHGLHVATTTLQWLVSAYAVTFGGFLLLGGRLADVFGRAKLYRIGLCVFVAASISGGLAVDPALLIASRAVQGLGAALLAPAGLSLLITSWTDEKQRSHALGVYGAVASAGFAAGAVIGGLLVQVTWRLVFFVNVPVGIALFAASWRLLPPDPPRPSGRLDVVGALTATVGVALLVLGVTRAGDTLQPTQPAVAFGAGIVLLVAFVFRERRAASPLLNLELLKDRSILGANECLLAFGACNAGAVLLVTLYLQEGRGLSPLLTGLCFIPQAVGAFALAGPASKLVPALGPRRALAAGMALCLLALVGSALSVARGPLGGLLASLFLLGVSARIVQVASTLAGTQGPVAARGEGSASAVLTASRQVGSALGVAVVSAILVTVQGDASHRTAAAMLVAAAFALVGLLTTRVVPSGPGQPVLLRLEHLFVRHAGGLP